MANVDSKLHDVGDPKDREGETPQRSLRGAAGGIYIGPVLSRAAVDGEGATLTHATGAAAGGADASTGYRGSNNYSVDGDATGQGMGAGGTASVRPTGRTMFRGDGLNGGSVAGYPAQRAGQRAAAAAGDTGTADSPTGAGAFIDKRSANAATGGIQLGAQGRGTRVKGSTVTRHGAFRSNGRPTMVAPTISSSHDPSAAGTVTIGTGTAAGLLVDLHADDVTGGASGLAGMEVFVFARDTDTDEDAGLVTKFDVDSATEADVSTGLTAATTYAVYARFKDTAGNVGPMSARATAATHA